MESRWLQAFVVVAEELHFSHAAARLHMAQSPLSQIIRKLEADLDVRLFERSTRSVELTAAGHALLPHAREVLERLETARQAAEDPTASVYGRLTVGFSGVLNQLSLPPLTSAVRRAYPGVTLNLVGRIMTREAVQLLDRGTLDIACVGLPVDSSRVRSRLIAEEALGVVLPAGHHRSGEEAVDLADLAEDDFVTTPAAAGSALHETTIDACQGAGFRPRVTQEITDPYMLLMLVAAGVGVAVMPEGIARLTPPGSVYRPMVQTSAVMRHGFAWSARGGSLVRDAVLELAESVLPTPE